MSRSSSLDLFHTAMTVVREREQGSLERLLVTPVAVFWFEVPLRGDLSALLLAFFLVMPTIILSGFAFPIANMPTEVQLLTWLDPLRYYLVVRDIFLKGAGISDHLFECGVMALLALAALSLSMLRLGWAD